MQVPSYVSGILRMCFKNIPRLLWRDCLPFLLPSLLARENISYINEVIDGTKQAVLE